MFDLPSSLPDPNRLPPEDRLFIHSVHPQWGVGVWVKEEKTRRRLRFEDGQMRAFKKGFYQLLDPIDPGRPDLDTLFHSLADEHAQAVAEKAESKARAASPPVMPFAGQIAVFRELYPGGFTDPAYIKDARGTGGTWAKRHVDEEIALAKPLFRKRALRERIADEDFDGILADLMHLLSRSTLVKPVDGVRMLEQLDDEGKRSFVLALQELLHSKKPFRERFGSWKKTLDATLPSAPSWPFATVFPALYRPEKHLCVKRTVLELQAREVKPGTTVPKSVNHRGYRRTRRIAGRVKQKLEEAGLEPRDLFDVRMFVWTTLRPKGRSIYETMQKR